MHGLLDEILLRPKVRVIHEQARQEEKDESTVEEARKKWQP